MVCVQHTKSFPWISRATPKRPRFFFSRTDFSPDDSAHGTAAVSSDVSVRGSALVRAHISARARARARQAAMSALTPALMSALMTLLTPALMSALTASTGAYFRRTPKYNKTNSKYTPNSYGAFGVTFGVTLAPSWTPKRGGTLVSPLVYGRKGCSTVLLYSFGVHFGVFWCDYERFLVRAADPRS